MARNNQSLTISKTFVMLFILSCQHVQTDSKQQDVARERMSQSKAGDMTVDAEPSARLTSSPTVSVSPAEIESANGEMRTEVLSRLLDSGAVAPESLSFIPVDVTQAGVGTITVYPASDYLRLATGETPTGYYYPGLSHDDAMVIASHYGMVFAPSTVIVDMVHRAAAERLPAVPLERATPGDQNSEGAAIRHTAAIQRAFADHHADSPVLLSGHKKDLLDMPADDRSRVAIYGWKGEGDKPIQKLSYAHSAAYRDYSQSARLYKPYVTITGEDGVKKDVPYEALRGTPWEIILGTKRASGQKTLIAAGK